MSFLLHRIRLSWFFAGFLLTYLTISFFFSGTALNASTLTLFSVNSFLYGFYIGPVLSAQKNRIDDLARAIRAEATSLFDMLLQTKKLSETTRNKIQDMFEDYLVAAGRQRKAAEGEEEYEAIITYCLNYKGADKEVIANILKGLVANQQNRSNLAMQLSNQIYSNEWLIMIVLFSITLGFVLTVNVGGFWVMDIVKALLCTGLSMLMINLLKLSTLTHKKAKSIWNPLHKLLTSRFYRID